MSERESSSKRGRSSQGGTPAVLCLMHVLQSDVGTVSPIARSAILSLLESLLSSVATQHIADTYRRPITSTMRDVADTPAVTVAATTQTPEPPADIEMATDARQAGAAAEEAAAVADAQAAQPTAGGDVASAGDAGPSSAAGVSTSFAAIICCVLCEHRAHHGQCAWACI